jgi:hypothetical protein
VFELKKPLVVRSLNAVVRLSKVKKASKFNF